MVFSIIAILEPCKMMISMILKKVGLSSGLAKAPGSDGPWCGFGDANDKDEDIPADLQSLCDSRRIERQNNKSE